MSDVAGPTAAGQLSPGARRRLWWLSFWGLWTAFGVLLAAPRVLVYGEGEVPATWTEALRIGILDMYSWAFVALMAAWLARRIPVGRGEWARATVLHVAAALVVLLVRFWGANGIGVALGWIDAMPPLSIMPHLLPFNLLFHFSLVGVGYAIEFYRRYRDRELEASRLALERSQLELASAALQNRLVEAQLQALKTQIQPHFLFNTLNAIATLVHHDPELADRMIACLGDLLRTTLAHRQHHEVTVQEELELLGPYLEIEQTRFGDRLRIETHSEPEVLDAQVPHLMLQPLIENAIRHGLAPRRAPGWIRVSVERCGAELLVKVLDNGIGLRDRPSIDCPVDRTSGDPGAEMALDRDAASPSPGGLGIGNIRDRLARLYGADGRLSIRPRVGGGTEVAIHIPYRRIETRTPAEV